MKRSANKLCVPLFFVAALFSNTVLAEETPWPMVTPDGLHRVTFSELSVVYLTSDADLGAYNRVKLLNPVVRFRRNWKAVAMT